jgi:serine/threonine protein kinase/tetratricopeptide (TPR) repeat protein
MPETFDSLLDRHVGAFELALRLGGAELEAYLPSPLSPVYSDVLVELIRVELEWTWRQGKPKSLADYQTRFPEVFDSVKHRDALVAEEARQRRLFTPTTLEGVVPIEPTPADLIATRVIEELRRRDDDPVAPSDRMARFPEPGDTYLDFKLVAELGRGAFGRVFLAHQAGLASRPVALKIGVDLHQESNTLAQLQHTNIVPIYSIHRASGLHAVCMPYFGRTTLCDVYRDLLLQKKVPLSGQALVSTWRERRTRSATSAHEPAPASAEIDVPGVETAFHKMARLSYVDSVLWLASRLTDGLAHAHERGILHRDLKPANILLTDEGEPMLLDFNLSSDEKVNATLARVGGTLLYMSPEQIEAFANHPVPLTPASDIYALGIILFEMLTGCPPFRTRKWLTMPEMIEDLLEDRLRGAPSARLLNPAVSPAGDAIVRRCLDPDPKRRYQSARDLGEDLRRQLDNKPLKHTPEPSLRERISKFQRRHPRLLSTTTCALVVLALGLLLGVALYWRGERVANLEARQEARRLHEDRREMEFLLTARSAPKWAQQAVELGNQALARFPEGTRRLGRLSEEERAQAQGDLRDVYWLIAQAHLLRVNPVHPDRTEEDLAAAETCMKEALRRYPEGDVPLSVRLQEARVARLRGRLAEADAVEKRAQAEAPKGPPDRYRLAFALAEQGRYKQALAAVADSLDGDKTPFNAWFLHGLCCDHLGRESEAVGSYTVCTALKQDVFEAYFNRGLAHARQREFWLARRDFNEVIRLVPQHADAYFNRALTFQATGDYKEAEADLTKALELGTEHTRLFLVRARVREKLNDTEGARQDRAEGMRREPNDVPGWVARGLARLPGDPKAALADFDAALQLDPRSMAALQNKAHVLGKYLDKTEEAVGVLGEAVKLYPEDVRPLAGRGILLARLRKDAEAIQDAVAALALDDSPANQYQVAGIYALVSQRGDASCRDRAFVLLTQALKKGFGGDLLAIDHDLNPLRDDPRFSAIESLARR